MYFFKQSWMETNKQTNKKESSFLKSLNLPDLGDCNLSVSVLPDQSFPVEGASLCLKNYPHPFSPTEIAAYFFYLCFCFCPSLRESANPVMWLCSVVLIAVEEAGCQRRRSEKMEKESNVLIHFGGSGWEGEGRGEDWCSPAIWRHVSLGSEI